MPVKAPSVHSDVDAEFRSLMHELAGEYDPECGLGSMTTTVYDTAWVACVQAPGGGQLFPGAFRAVLDAQDEGGGWSKEGDHCSQIVCSLAGLHALIRCQKTCPWSQLHDRIRDAERWLRASLEELHDVEGGGVAFELIVPCLLNLLAREQVVLEFPQKERLLDLRRQKLAKIPVQMLYSTPTSLLHSLEAFLDDPDIDYDQFIKYKVGGSLMASPSSTAAYMMRSSSWDDDAEAYLRRVLQSGAGKGVGTVPSAFPSTHFETAWVLSTTLSAGFDLKDIPDGCRQNLIRICEESGVTDGRCVGFAPGLVADLDDTARMSITASLLGLPRIVHAMVASFGCSPHMETYERERNASFSANCNALMALLVEPPPVVKGFTGTIEKVTRFLCETWASTSSLPADKWNVSPHYAPMLMAESFARLLDVDRRHGGASLPAGLIEEEVPRALVQYTIRTIQAQNPDGSWGAKGPREETAYSIIGLTSILETSVCRPLSMRVQEAVEQGRRYLQHAGPHSDPERLWVEKVLFGSHMLSTAYVLSALRLSREVGRTHPQTEPEPVDLTAKERESLKLMKKLPTLQGCASWLLEASIIEARTFIPSLRLVRQKMFSRDGFTKDRYFDWIPLIWTMANNSLGGHMTSTTMADMMAISIINFQVDEFMESVVASEFAGRRAEMAAWIARETRAGIGGRGDPDGVSQGGGSDDRPGTTHEADATTTATPIRSPGFTEPMTAFFDHIRSHPRVRAASVHDRDRLFSEIRRFLDAHLTQNGDNALLVRRPGSARGDVRAWVRGTAADHTSCPYSFAFAACISGRDGGDFLPGLGQKYAAEDVCRHLAAMCRLYNDAGSLRRDRDEGNLNVADFAALRAGLPESLDDGARFAALRARILSLASYERAMMEVSYGELRELSDEGPMGVLDVFIRVTDMFGEIYILKDLASRNLKK